MSCVFVILYKKDKRNILLPERKQKPASFSENERRNENSTTFRRRLPTQKNGKEPSSVLYVPLITLRKP